MSELWDAIDEYRLWQPGRKGYAAARRELERVWLTETPNPQGDPMTDPAYTSVARNIVYDGQVIATVPMTPNAIEAAGLLASKLNGADKDRATLEQIAELAGGFSLTGGTSS